MPLFVILLTRRNMNDTELYILRHTNYAHLSDSEAAENIANDKGYTYSGVRGQLSRARHNNAAKAALMKVLTQQAPTLPISVKRQLNIIAESEAVFEAWSKENEPRRGVFISDMHAPYNRIDAYQLALEIMQYWQPHAITALNDGLENKGYGRHEDNEAVFQMLWRGDFANARAVQSAQHRDFKSTLTANGKLLGLLGNHDRWIFDFWRANDPQTAEKKIADYLEELYYKDNVLIFSRGIYENHIHLSSGLVFTHGLTTAKNPLSRAKTVLSYFMENGVAKSVVQGHVHDAFVVEGARVGMRGVTFVQNGMLRNTDVDWMHRDMRDWRMTITLVEYNPQEWAHKVHLLPFEVERDMLVARFRGLEWAVKLDTSRPL